MEEEQSPMEWQAPPPPEQIPAAEPPQMSEVAALGNVFFEPGRVFEDMKRKPRFIIGLVIVTILASIYPFALNYKVGEENSRRFVAAEIDKSSRGQGLDAQQRSKTIELTMTIRKFGRYSLPILIPVFIFIGALIYWLGAKAFGGTGGFLHSVSVWVYSSIPPTIVTVIVNGLILIFKSVDDIDLAASQRSLISASPALLVDGKAHPVLATFLGSFDLFFIWGWILAAIGLRIVSKISSGSSWAVVIIVALIFNIGLRLLGAIFSGNPG